MVVSDYNADIGIDASPHQGLQSKGCWVQRAVAATHIMLAALITPFAILFTFSLSASSTAGSHFLPLSTGGTGKGKE